MSGLQNIDTNPESEPVRLFKSDFLEFFTHISPITIVVIWAPVIVYLVYTSVQNVAGAGFPWLVVGGVVIGLFLWTMAEYLLHRFFFHYHPSDPAYERIFFLFHGVHHAQPQDKTRLVMPPPVSIILAGIFYALFYVVIGLLLKAPLWVNPVMAGFVLGYLFYDLTHYATHHFPMRGPIGKYLKRHHMQHHYKSPDIRFGVSSPLWDLVFRTMEEQK